MAYKQLIIWGSNATQASNAQTLRKTVNVSQFTIEKVKVKKKKKLMANAALMAHILSETTRDESTLTYADNSI